MKLVQLTMLMGTYFDQERSTPAGTIRRYLDESTEADIRTLVVDVDELLDVTAPGDVRRALTDLGSTLRLGDSPRAYVDWLRDIREASTIRLSRIENTWRDPRGGRPALEVLLEDLDEEIEAMGMVLVGHLVWMLRGMKRGLTDVEMQELSEQAWAIVRERYPSHLARSDWPTDLATARPADESTPLEFDLDPDEPVGRPLLVLVIDD